MPSQTSPGSSLESRLETPQYDASGLTEERLGPEQTLPMLDQAAAIAAMERGGAAVVYPLPLLPTLLNGGAAAHRPVWRSYGVSMVLHVAGIALVLLLAIPASLVVRRHAETVILLAPKLETYKPKPPRVAAIKPLRHFVPVPEPVRPRPPIQLETPAPPQIASAPVSRPAPVVPEVKIQVAEPPRARVLMGAFGQPDVVKTAPPPRQVTPAGFGDPQGVRPQSQSTSPVTLARLGGFERSNADAKGPAARGVVARAGFGSIDGGNGTAAGTGRTGAVRAGGFGDGSATATGTGSARPGTVHAGGFEIAAAPSGGARQPALTPPATTPAEILSKPKPAYTQEARALKIEGQVSLEVVFEAAGTVRILRMVRGLGHGLDEAAEHAAQQVRFRPATRGGMPVDVNATLYITFQLT